MGLLRFTGAIVGVADIRPTFDLNSHLVAKLAFEFFLDADVRIGAEREDDSALGGV